MKNICLLFIIILFTACRQDASPGMNFGEAENAKITSYQSKNYAENTNANIERKTIKTANIRFRVKDLLESTKRIEAIVEQYDGFISGMNQSTSNYSLDNKMTLRIPAEALEKFLAEIEQESTYTHHKRIQVQDITEEFVDKTNRLNTKKEVRDRYIAILRDKAQTVKDVLNAEEKIRVIQEEIESIEGRLKYLNNQTTLSTVHIDMYQKTNYNPVSNEASFFTKVVDGFMNGWELIQMICIGLVTIWPIISIALTLFLGRKKIRKVFGKNKTE